MPRSVSSCQVLHSHQDPAQIAPTLGSPRYCSDPLWMLSPLELAQYQIFGNSRLSLRGLVAEGGHRGVLGMFGLPRCAHVGVWVRRVEADWGSGWTQPCQRPQGRPVVPAQVRSGRGKTLHS